MNRIRRSKLVNADVLDHAGGNHEVKHPILKRESRGIRDHQWYRHWILGHPPRQAIE